MPRTGRQASISAADYRLTVTEAQWQDLVVETAKMFGWLVVHIRKMQGNPEGLPDLLLWRGDCYLLAELKTERGKLRASQQRWHTEAAQCGVTVHRFRPSDWPEIEALLRGE